MKRKYLDERFGFFFEFGKSNDGKQIGVASGDNPDVCLCSPEQAKWLIENHNAAIDMMEKLANALQEVAPEKLSEIYYGG